MAGDAKKLQPIIVKRIKKGGHAHHGGAWKIAYADFVTAMMAFFLLMWLLGSTSEGDKKGIADYFNTPLKVALLQSGSGSGDSASVLHGGGEDLTRAGGQVKRGDVEAPQKTINLQALKAEQQRAEQAQLEDLKEKVEQKLSDNPATAALMSQLRLDMTRDGLRIQIVDEDKRPMFDSGSAAVRAPLRELLQAIGSVLVEVPNRITIEGHTDSTPFAAGDRGYGNWELSADRANASRRELVVGGVTNERVLRVQGMASSMPIDAIAPSDPQNRRISIIVMNREAEDRVFRAAPETQTATSEAPAAAPAAAAAPATAPAAAHEDVHASIPGAAHR
jgi:chemotaxis protein MotB